MTPQNENANAVAGTLFYMAIGILFFGILFMIASIGHATYVPRLGDIVPCSEIHTVAEKHVVLDSWGLYVCSVSFTDGAVFGINCEDYNTFPSPGQQVWPRGIAIRMRSGATIDSWLVVNASRSNVENACIIMNDQPTDKSCQKPARFNNTLWVNQPEFIKQSVCWANSTVGGF